MAKRLSEKEYKKMFAGAPKRALEIALQNREGEISRYWVRTAYAWAFTAAAFAAYFAVISPGTNEKFDGAAALQRREFLAYVVACFGLVVSVGWVLMNKGSKFWQENWENHVDMLEDGVVGSLFKTTLKRPPARTPGRWINEILTGPGPFSVSKVNMLISWYVAAIWALLAYESLPSTMQSFCLCASSFNEYTAVGSLSVAAIVTMLFLARTNLKAHWPKARLRKVWISD